MVGVHSSSSPRELTQQQEEDGNSRGKYMVTYWQLQGGEGIEGWGYCIGSRFFQDKMNTVVQQHVK